jgi:outer membrane protein OmpA-like peptidoglycan-associated protein
LKDGEEINLYKTNPTKADTDQDGLNDNEEITKYKTDPLKADSDGEGLNDGDEIKKYKTDPLKTDTDGDGLYDGEEVMKHKTDPLKKDTDGGSIDDLTEIIRGTNPLDANDDVIKIGVPIVLEGVTFESNKADITPESSQILRTALKTLTTYPEIQVEISGHTDNVGSKKTNTKLSQRRADSVRNWLIERGIDSGRIVAKGYGPDVPIVPNDSPDNKRKNRRIEFKRIK